MNATDTFAESRCGTEIAWSAGDASARYVSATSSCGDQTVTLGTGKHFRCLEGEADLDLPKLDWLINKLTEARAAITSASESQPLLRGIVRDYHSGSPRPYQRLFDGVPDGHTVEVLMRDLGMSEAGQLQRWQLSESHTYEQVPLQATV